MPDTIIIDVDTHKDAHVAIFNLSARLRTFQFRPQQPGIESSFGGPTFSELSRLTASKASDPTAQACSEH